MYWAHRILLHNSSIYRRIVKRSKQTVPSGFGTLSLYEVISSLVHDLMNGTMLNKASSLAYNFMLAFFPGVLFLFTLIPYVPVKNFQGRLMSLLSTIIPYNAYMAF